MLRDFQPFVINMGLQYSHHLWALLLFIIIILFFFEVLTRIYCSLPLKVHEILIILGLGK